MSVNKAILIGRLGKDPEDRGKFVTFSIAMTEKWKGKDGEWKEKTEWLNIVVFSEGAQRVAKAYLKKGSQVYVEGRIQTRKWQDKNGNDKYTTEVVASNLTLLDKRTDSQPDSAHEGDDGSAPF